MATGGSGQDAKAMHWYSSAYASVSAPFFRDYKQRQIQRVLRYALKASGPDVQ